MDKFTPSESDLRSAFDQLAKEIASDGRWFDRIRKKPGTISKPFLQMCADEMRRYANEFESMIEAMS